MLLQHSCCGTVSFLYSRCKKNFSIKDIVNDILVGIKTDGVTDGHGCCGTSMINIRLFSDTSVYYNFAISLHSSFVPSRNMSRNQNSTSKKVVRAGGLLE